MRHVFDPRFEAYVMEGKGCMFLPDQAMNLSAVHDTYMTQRCRDHATTVSVCMAELTLLE